MRSNLRFLNLVPRKPIFVELLVNDVGMAVNMLYDSPLHVAEIPPESHKITAY